MLSVVTAPNYVEWRNLCKMTKESSGAEVQLLELVTILSFKKLLRPMGAHPGSYSSFGANLVTGPQLS